MRASIASNFEVASISTIRAELPGILKLTVRLGNVREGDSLTVSDGMTANPIRDIATNATMTVNADMWGVSFIFVLYFFLAKKVPKKQDFVRFARSAGRSAS
jgi:hypothetical protein